MALIDPRIRRVNNKLDSAIGMLDESAALIRKVANAYPAWALDKAEDFDTAVARLTFDFQDEAEMMDEAREWTAKQ